MQAFKQRPGRPRKYGRPSRAVTVTLPEDVLDRLNTINDDLGRAIVTVVERRAPRHARAVPRAELTSYGNRAVIVVTPVKALKRLAGVQLVPIGDGRALISLESPHSIPQLELDIRDAIERDAFGVGDRQTLEATAAILRQARSSPRITLGERTIIVLETKRRRSP